MYFFSEYQIREAVNRYVSTGQCEKVNTARAVMVLDRLMVWTNRNSDGWAYWPKPMRAASQLARLVEDRTNRRNLDDITDHELKKALVPIKSFLTRQGVAHSEIIKET